MTKGAQTREGGARHKHRAAAYTTKGAEVLCLAIDLDA